MARRQGRKPHRVETFGQFVLATGGAPLLRVGEPRLLRGPFLVDASYADNAAVDVDLTLCSAWNRRIQGFYGGSGVPLKASLRIAGFFVYVNDADFRGEAQALKEALDNGAYLHLDRSGAVIDFPITGTLVEPYSAIQFHETTNSDVERTIMAGKPWIFERPYQLDLETDGLSLVGPAINWASGAIALKVGILGHIGPKGFPGTDATDINVCGIDSGPNAAVNVYESTGPAQFAELGLTGVGKATALGAGQFASFAI